MINFKLLFKLLLVSGTLLFLIFLAYFLNFRYRVKTGQLTYWEGEYYTPAQLEERFGRQYYDTPAKNTPEEVYAEFRQALLENDVEKALGKMSEYRKGEYREIFKEEDKIKEWVKRLPENIVKEDVYKNNAEYYYLNANESSDKMAHPISFTKNKDGYWQIDQI